MEFQKLDFGLTSLFAIRSGSGRVFQGVLQSTKDYFDTRDAIWSVTMVSEATETPTKNGVRIPLQPPILMFTPDLLNSSMQISPAQQQQV